MTYSSGIFAKSTADSNSDSNLPRCSASCSFCRVTAYFVRMASPCVPVNRSNASAMYGSAALAWYRRHKSIRLAFRRSSFRTTRSISGSARRCAPRSVSRTSGSFTNASTQSCLPVISLPSTSGCFSQRSKRRRPMGERHLFKRPYSEKPAAALPSAGAAFAEAADDRSGNTFRARKALESRRMYRPVSCITKQHRPWFAGSLMSSENFKAAASAAAAFFFSSNARCLSTPAAPALTAAPTSGTACGFVASLSSLLLSSLARSSSTSRESKSVALRSVASAPHRVTTSRNLRPSGVVVGSTGNTHSFAPSWQSTASNVQNCSSSTNSHAPSSRVVGLTYATPTTRCSCLKTTRTAATIGVSPISLPPRNKSSSNAPNFPGDACFCSCQPCLGISS
mmetsp:Transcript_1239/g.4729  ORF Transcript_1239/g.4729 Transcript_1239/m.4729 type:complete len:395 (-) Transcript_1239:375-1559(-)